MVRPADDKVGKEKEGLEAATTLDVGGSRLTKKRLRQT